MAGIGKYKKGKAFSLKSGNKPSFFKMGSSPAKKMDVYTNVLDEEGNPDIRKMDTKSYGVEGNIKRVKNIQKNNRSIRAENEQNLDSNMINKHGADNYKAYTDWKFYGEGDYNDEQKAMFKEMDKSSDAFMNKGTVNVAVDGEEAKYFRGLYGDKYANWDTGRDKDALTKDMTNITGKANLFMSDGSRTAGFPEDESTAKTDFLTPESGSFVMSGKDPRSFDDPNTKYPGSGGQLLTRQEIKDLTKKGEEREDSVNPLPKKNKYKKK